MDSESFFAAHEVHVGMDVGGREFVVTAEQVATYRAGTGADALPAPLATGAPAPALLHHSEVYRSLAWYLPNIVGNLHARQEWEFFSPMWVGDTVRSRSTVVDRYRKRNRVYIVNEVLFTDATGRWLQRSRTHQSFLAEETPGVLAPGASPATVVDRERERRSDRQFAVGAFDGEEIPPLERAITTAMCEAFSGPGKNYHTDREMAQMLGFPDIVVQGMMSICFLSDLVERHVGRGWQHGGKLDVRLVNVVWNGDTLTARGKVRERAPEAGRERVTLEVWCEKADGAIATVGTASAIA